MAYITLYCLFCKKKNEMSLGEYVRNNCSDLCEDCKEKQGYL